MPILWLEPHLAKSIALDPERQYNCPFYKTSRRAGVLSTTGHSTNFVTTISLPISPLPGGDSQSHWIRRGTAILAEDELGLLG